MQSYWKGTASLLKTIVDTKQKAVTPILDSAIEVKKSVLQSPIISSVVGVKSSVLETLPKAVEPVFSAIPMLLRSTLCNIGCPLLGTEQCKKDHCEGYEETEDISEEKDDSSEKTEDISGIEPRTKEDAVSPYNIVEAADDTL